MLAAGCVLTLCLAGSGRAESAGTRAVHGATAVAANLVPGVSTVYAPQCLPGYLVCKLLFAGASVVAAGGQLVLSAGGDLGQTRAILYRGLAGDWYLTPDHTAGRLKPAVLLDPPPPSSGAGAPRSAADATR